MYLRVKWIKEKEIHKMPLQKEILLFSHDKLFSFNSIATTDKNRTNQQ